MTIEEIPESGRCPDCGTWLPRDALACPKCGRPRDLAVAGLAGRQPLSRRVVIGGGAGVAILLGAIVLWAVNQPAAPASSASPSLASGVAQASPSSRPTVRPAPSDSPSPRPTPVPSRTPRPTPVPVPQLRGPLLVMPDIPDMGRRATVTALGPPVRGYFGADDGPLVLAVGSELLLKDGPVSEDGYDWYEAYVSSGPTGNQVIPESAWVAAGLAGEGSTLIEIGALRCPTVPTTIALLGSMTDLARRECLGDRSVEVYGVLDLCYHDGVHPFTQQPAWLGPTCDLYLAYELGTTWRCPSTCRRRCPSRR